MPRKIFVNLPVADLDRSRAFFKALGFAFDDRFCDSTAACLALADDINVMLLGREKFASFTPLPVADATQATEVLLAISADSRTEVNTLISRVEAAGGTAIRDEDHGWMVGRAFRDLDGHIWEVVWMDPAAMPAQGEAAA